MKGQQEFKILFSPRKVKCNICLHPINKGERRLTANLGSGHFSHHFHVSCFVMQYRTELYYLLKITTSHPNLQDHFNPSDRSSS